MNFLHSPFTFYSTCYTVNTNLNSTHFIFSFNLDMESEKVKLVDYSSSGEEEEDMEWDQDNIKTDNFGNLEQNLEENVKIGENCQMDQNRMDIRKIAVVQPQKYGTVQNQDNSEGTESDVDFTQNSDENQNLEENLENVTNQVNTIISSEQKCSTIYSIKFLGSFPSIHRFKGECRNVTK